MHLLVFILALVNLLFFAYGQGYLGHADNPDKVRLQQQLNPEKIKLLSAGDPPAPPKPESTSETGNTTNTDTTGETLKEAPPKESDPAKAPEGKPDKADKGDKENRDSKAAQAAANAVSQLTEASKNADNKSSSLVCLSWTTGDKDKAEAFKRSLLKQYSPQSVQLSSIAGSEAARWWVYLPPHADSNSAEQQLDKLKEAGFHDYSLITGEGQNRLAISLGLFSSEDGARQRQKELSGKGFRNVQIQARGKPGQYVVEARIPDKHSADIKASASKQLPSDSKSKTCKA